MLKHNLLIIFRNFLKNRNSFLINLIGLSTGLACTLLIYLWVSDEISFDKHLENDDRLYQVMENQSVSTGIITQEATPDLLAETMAEELPEIEFASAVAPSGWFGDFGLSAKDKGVYTIGQFAGKDFFEVFSHTLLAGDPDNALQEANHIALSESLAKKLFGTVENSLGQTVEWELQHLKKATKVTVVFEDLPDHSTMEYDFVLSFESWKDVISEARELHWDNHGPRTYVLLKENVKTDDFNSKIKGFIKEKLPSSNVNLFVRKYSDQYLYGDYENGMQSGGRITYVKLFSIIAIAVLFIACINFMNLSTAKASTRLKEVGVKKSIGANRATLVFQHLGESISLALISLFLAFIFVELLLPQFNLITGKDISLTYSWGMVMTSLIIVMITGILAGSYPAFYLTSFKPAAVLKGKLNISFGELWVRKGLVVIQFTLSIVLILSVLIIYNQVNFLLERNIGYDRENVIFIQKDGKISGNISTFVEQVKQLDVVANVSGTQHTMIGSYASTEGLHWKGKNPDESIRFENFTVDYDFIETMGITILEGRSFSRDHRTDSTGLVINQKAAEIISFEDPIGQEVNLWGNKATIIGVVQDFNYKSLHEKVEPAFFKLAKPNQVNFIVTRIKPGREKEAIEGINKIYSQYDAENEFNYQFLDQRYEAQYKSEERTATLAQFFAAMAILISCLGLFGLVSFMAERRLKEIGIRKVLGSGKWGIVTLLTGDFTKTILVAVILALPIGYYIISMWLDQYSYRIELSPFYFIAAGAIALLVAWVTVSGQAFKAARVNPTECLKNE